jgi:tetratricopeptide (TPR) repeat protein
MYNTYDEIFGYALLRYQTGHLDEAVKYFTRAIKIAPTDIKAHVNLGVCLRDLKRLDESCMALRRAILVMPESPEAHLYLALVYADLDQVNAAVHHMTLCNQLSDSYLARYNFAALCNRLGMVEQALHWYERTLEVAPGDRETLFFRGCLQLLQGNFAEGWVGYELRKDRFPQRRLGEAVLELNGFEWQGEDITDKHILVHVEQGFGDTIHSARYIPWLAARCRQVTVVPGYELVRLLRHSFSLICNIDVQTNMAEPYDGHVWIDSLPGLFDAGIAPIPTEPYLYAANNDEWVERFAGLIGKKVGIVWAGGHAGYPSDRYRSMRREQIEPLCNIPGISLVSLQIGQAAVEGMFDASPFIDDWFDTAAAISALDLIISSDTAVAHLAGAMGKPVWLLNMYASFWQWGEAGSASLWYPNTTIFRQPAFRDWDTVIRTIATRLVAYAFADESSA